MQEQIRFEGFEPPETEENTEKNITCCFTGHRDLDLTTALFSTLRAEIEKAYQLGYRIFCAGGALGFDTMAALNVLALRNTAHNDMRLHLVLPYREQSERWSKHDRHMYNEILKQADVVEYTSEQYTNWCMHTRNRRLVELSSYCICYLRADGKSGTAYTVDYARKKGLHTVNLAETH